MNGQERRAAVRVKYSSPINVGPANYRHVATHDISRRGIKFDYPESLNAGDILDIEFKDAYERRMNAKCRVVRVDRSDEIPGEPRYLIGAEFLDTNTELLSFIDTISGTF